MIAIDNCPAVEYNARRASLPHPVKNTQGKPGVDILFWPLQL